MGIEGTEQAIRGGGLVAVWFVLVAGVFIGLTPGAYAAGPAVLGYINIGVDGRRGVLMRRALAFVVGAALPMAAFGLLLGIFGDMVLALIGEQVVVWYLLVAVIAGATGLLLSGLVVARVPSYVPIPQPVASSRGAFLLGLPLGLAACPSCTPLLFPIAAVAAASGGPLYGGGLLLLFGLARGVPILLGAASLAALRRLRRLIPFGLSAQRIAGWLLLATAVVYLLQAALIATGRSAWFT
jgi:cytochrome c-type biogenesis protein